MNIDGKRWNGEVMMTEAYVSDDELMEYYGDIDDVSQIGSISQMPVNFGLVSKF